MRYDQLTGEEKVYDTAYGKTVKPFGIKRIRIVEFLAQAFSVFPKEMHKDMLSNGLYDCLLYYFELYPYHNILHSKVNEILILALEKNHED